MTRHITPDQADAAYAILVKHAGAQDAPEARMSFVYTVPDNCREYRFGGALGWGGKFRNNDRGVYVDCYQEHETPERLAMIAATNAALAELFGKNNV